MVKAIVDWLCIFVSAAIAITVVVLFVFAFYKMGMDCYEVTGSAAQGWALGTLPIWFCACLRGIHLLVTGEVPGRDDL